MKAKLNKLDKLFGPSGSFSGQIIFYAGIIMLYYSFMAVVLIVLGAFVGFSTEGIKIDFDNKKVKTLIILFGFLPFGKWIQIKGDERIVVKASGRTYRTYSMANIPLDIRASDYRVILKNPSEKFKIHLQKFKTKKDAEEMATSYARLLQLEREAN